MNKKKITFISFCLLLAINTAQSADALFVRLQNGSEQGTLLDNVQRLSFTGDNLSVKTLDGNAAVYTLDDIAKITFGTMIITDVVEKNNYPSLPANIIGYYSILGTRLSKEPQSGVYITVYDNGTIQKIVK